MSTIVTWLIYIVLIALIGILLNTWLVDILPSSFGRWAKILGFVLAAFIVYVLSPVLNQAIITPLTSWISGS